MWRMKLLTSCWTGEKETVTYIHTDRHIYIHAQKKTEILKHIDILSPSRPHYLIYLQLPKIVPAATDQAFNL